MSSAERTALSTKVPMFVGTVAVMAASAFCAARAFVDLAPLTDYLVIVIVAAATIAVMRSVRVGAGLAFALSQPIGLIVIAAIFELPYRAGGVVPTLSTMRFVRAEMADSFATFLQAVPPVDASVGFVVPLAVVLWFATTFGLFAAVDAQSPLHATAAPIALFIATSVLLRGTYAVTATVLSVVSLALLRVASIAHRANRGNVATQGDPSQRSGGVAVLWASMVPMFVIALAVGAVASVALPSTGTGMVDLRELGRRDPPRTVASPLVSVSSLLRQGTDETLFRVRAASAHYWRLTSLDAFDGRSWTSTSSYSNVNAGDRLRTTTGGAATTIEVDQEFLLDAEFSEWMPAAFAPSVLDVDTRVQYDAESASIFLPEGVQRDDLTYSVRSEVPVLDAATIAAASGAEMSQHSAATVPDSLSPRAIELAIEVAGSLPPLEAGQALEAFFHDPSFVYDIAADYSNTADPLGDFLDQRVGFCQQYATAFAAMARVLGIPSRVAVGFIPGSATPLEDGRTEFAVSGLDGHAWPELYLDGVGWVAFEPTPGRSNPDASGYSAAPPAENQTQPPAPTTTAAPAPTSAPDATPTTAAPPLQDGADAPAPTEDAAGDSSSPDPTWIVVGVVTLVGLGALAWRIRAVRHRSHAATDPNLAAPERVASAWERIVVDLARVDIVSSPSQTPIEFATHAAELIEQGWLEPDDTTQGPSSTLQMRPSELVAVAVMESQRRYGNDEIDNADAQQAALLAEQIHAAVWQRLGSTERVKALVTG